jgi:hypothetical protein
MALRIGIPFAISLYESTTPHLPSLTETVTGAMLSSVTFATP